MKLNSLEEIQCILRRESSEKVLLESYAKDRQSQSFIIEIMRQLENDKEYYVKKAVEWTKRNLVKYGQEKFH